ncbi:MAG: hypothetical protein WC879_01555 [Melioribacteraceae bacterium]
MKKLHFIIILIIIAGTINAQSIAIGAQGAYVKSQDADAVIMPSAAIRLGFGGLKVEGSIGYKSDKFDGGAIKTTTYPVMLTGFLGLLPFLHLEAGIGWYNTKVEYSIPNLSIPSETYSDIGYHAGAGAEIPLGNIILTGDIRYVISKEKFNNARSTKDLNPDFYMIVVGLMFKLY